MNRLEVILSAMLFVSVALNIGIFMYARAAVTRLLSISEELGDLQQMVNSFAVHIKAVYELDSFYGDETLRGLLEHAVSFNEQMDTFEYIYSLTEEETQPTEEEEYDKEEEENTT